MLKNELNIVIVGLNHLYTCHKPVWTSYDEMYQDVIENNQCFSKIDISNILNKPNENFNTIVEEIFIKLNKEEIILNDDFMNKLLNKYEFSVIPQKYLKTNMIIYNDNRNLFIDFLICKYLKIEKYFIFLNREELAKRIDENHHNFIICDYELDNLLKYKNSWLCLLCPFNLLTTKVKSNEFIKDCENKNIEIINKHGIVYHFTAKFFYQLGDFFNIVTELNNQFGRVLGYEEFQNYLTKQNFIRILIINRSILNKSNFRKGNFFINGSKLIYLYHIGGNSLDINGMFDSVFLRASDPEDHSQHKDFWEQVIKYEETHQDCFFVNSIVGLDIFVDRNKMVDFFNYFTELETVKKLSSNLSLKFPKSFYMALPKISSFDDFNSVLSELSIKLPIILKFKSDISSVYHQLFIIFNENGLLNIQSELEKIPKETTVVIQEYDNHSSYIIKLYRINEEINLSTRPSTPDFNINNNDHIPNKENGYMKLQTPQLQTEEYKEYWNSIPKDDVYDLIDHNYLKELSDLFEKESGKNLFGLDFLYDKDNSTYYLIDANFFPAYRELNDNIPNAMRKHFINYYEKFKKLKN